MRTESNRSVLLILVALGLQLLAGCAGPNAQAPRVIEIAGGQTAESDRSSSGQQAAGRGEATGENHQDSSTARRPDLDGDGISDDLDHCPDALEDRDGFEDDDGCPDSDNDSDGVWDADDKCPNEPENKDGVEDEDGCPETNLTRAKQAFRDGATSFAQGDYVQARRFFEEAYNLEPRDAVLFNIAVAAEKQGDRTFACKYYRKWQGTTHAAKSGNRVPGLENCP